MATFRRTLLSACIMALAAAACSASPEESSLVADAGAGGQAGGGNNDVGGGAVASGGAGTGGASTAPAGTPTWSGEIAELVGAHCARCHTAGAAASLSFDTYADAAPMAGAMAGAVQAGRMPPWQADPNCRHYVNERILPAAARDALLAWVEGGAPEGDETGVRAVDPNPPPESATADLTARAAEAYAPDPARPDDYRCFGLDAEFPAETYIVGTDVVPDIVPIVHHVLLYVVPAERLADLERLDAEDPGPGYTCYGGPNLGTVGPMAAWVPGYQVLKMPERVATIIPAGSRLVMQVHYNTLASPSVPDRTSVHLWTSPTPPQFAMRSRPLANLDIVIPAGEADSVQTMEIHQNGRTPWTIVGVAPHMHMLGRHIRVEALRADGAESCLVDIPRWDFNWQQNYRFLEGEALTLQPGEKLRLTCSYDNSPANQPVVNGEQASPRDVTWGEGTLDEMCLAFINVVEPFTPNQGFCADLPTCRDACADPLGFGCYLDCAQADQSCATCLIQSVVGVGGCGRTACAASLAPAGDCLRTCIPQAITQGKPITECLQASCPAEYTALHTCMNSALAAGQCDSDLAECDVTR